MKRPVGRPIGSYDQTKRNPKTYKRLSGLPDMFETEKEKAERLKKQNPNKNEDWYWGENEPHKGNTQS